MFLTHSVVLKLMTYTLAGTAAFFEAGGPPGSVAYAAFATEAVGGAMLVLGIQTHWVALALSPILIGVVLFAHANKVLKTNTPSHVHSRHALGRAK